MLPLQNSVKKASQLAAMSLKFLIVLMIIAICVQIFLLTANLSTLNGQAFAQWGNLPASQSPDFEDTNGEMLAHLIFNMLNQSFLLAMLVFTTAIFNDASKHYTPFSEKQSTRLRIV